MADDLTILRNVGETLQTLLKENIAVLDEVLFESPADMTVPTGNKGNLSLFLYQVMENIHLRNRNLEARGPERLGHSPVILDLHYLATPYAKNREGEFDLLEKVVRTFYDHATLRGSVLKGMLLDSGNEELRVEPHYLSLEELNHLWSTFTKPLKPSIAYIVTPVRIPSTRELGTQRVVHKEDRYHQIVGK